VQENEEKGSEAGSLSAVNFSAVSHNGQVRAHARTHTHARRERAAYSERDTFWHT